MHKSLLLLGLIGFCGTLTSSAFCIELEKTEPEKLVVGSFSAEQPKAELPKDWEEIRFPSVRIPTKYTLQTVDEKTVLRAESDSGASMLGRELEINLNRLPVVSWSWQVKKAPKACDLTQKRTDDAPARLLITFGRSLRSPTPAISYVWSTQADKGKIFPSPYNSKICTIALRGSEAPLNSWQHEKRNVAKDYQTCFGNSAPTAKGLALLTDMDNTSQSAHAFFGDITFFQENL